MEQSKIKYSVRSTTVLLHFLCLLYNLSKYILLFFLIYFICVAVILLASLALVVQLSLPNNTAGKPVYGAGFLLCSIKSPVVQTYC